MNVLDVTWKHRLINLAREVSAWSKDSSTKVGAVITETDGRPVSWGFNGMPMGVDDSIQERHERPLKYKWMCHAERNAMDLAPKGDLSGCVMFVTLSPCTNCAQSIIQRRISTLVVDPTGTIEHAPEKWQEDMKIAMDMLIEAGVKIV